MLKKNQWIMDNATRHRIAGEKWKVILENWKTGRYRIMVATTTFGAGNDYPGVWVVILANTPFDMALVVQEFGRIRQCVISSLQKTYHIDITKKVLTSVDAR